MKNKKKSKLYVIYMSPTPETKIKIRNNLYFLYGSKNKNPKTTFLLLILLLR